MAGFGRRPHGESKEWRKQSTNVLAMRQNHASGFLRLDGKDAITREKPRSQNMALPG